MSSALNFKWTHYQKAVLNIAYAFRNLVIAAWRLARLRLRYALWKRFGCVALMAGLVALPPVPARAESCQTYRQGSDTLTQCDNGRECRSYEYGGETKTECTGGGRDEQ